MVKSELELATEAVTTLIKIIKDPNGPGRQERANHAVSIAKGAAVSARQVANVTATPDALQNAAIAEQTANNAEMILTFL